MTKILLALAILGSGGAAVLTGRQSTERLHHEANATRESWLLETQLVAQEESDLAALTDRMRQLNEALAQVPAATENPLWLALRTNQVGHLPPELRERLFEELDLSWSSSEEFIVVSKETVHELSIKTIQDGKLTEVAGTMLALTPGERSQVQTAIQRVQIDFNNWVRAHTERSEPTGDVVAEYTLHNDTSLSISNRFASGLLEAVGKQRAELILTTAPSYFFDIGMHKEDATILEVKRYQIGNETRHKFEVFYTNDGQHRWGMIIPREVSKDGWFPPSFRAIFPQGWADVAEREGFELR